MTLELHSVTKSVEGRLHIKETTLTFDVGRFHVLLGSTGSGKTSLIKLMAGLDRPSGGRILMNGQDVTRAGPQKRQIGLVHQFFVNYPHMTIYDNIASPLKVAGVAESEIRDQVESTATLLRLESLLDRFPHELSGGQQQRTALARAIAKESQFVFLDEPLANLDYKLREELREELPELFAGRGTVVVYATSEPEEALLLGGQTILMDDGRVVQSGQAARVYRHPNSLLSASVFSDPPINTARVVKQGDVMTINKDVQWSAEGEVATLPDGDYILAVRPCDVLPDPVLAEPSSIRLVGCVVLTEITGSESSAHFRFGEESWVSLARTVRPYGIGSEHQFFLDLSQAFLFMPDGRVTGACAR